VQFWKILRKLEEIVFLGIFGNLRLRRGWKTSIFLKTWTKICFLWFSSFLHTGAGQYHQKLTANNKCHFNIVMDSLSMVRDRQKCKWAIQKTIFFWIYMKKVKNQSSNYSYICYKILNYSIHNFASQIGW
jgi:hypothetical protein